VPWTTISGTLLASRVMGTRSAAESMAMLWPWLARITQSEGSCELGSGGDLRAGLGFIEKRCLELSVTAFWISSNLTLRDLSLCHFI